MRVEKLENCVGCSASFVEVERRAKNMCSKCYGLYYYTLMRKDKPEKSNNCSQCNVAIGSHSPRGRKINKLVKGLCEYCYSRMYTANSCKHCKSCGVEFRTVRLNCLCNFCKPKKVRPSKRKTDSKAGRKPKEFKLKRSNLSAEQLTIMLTLFRRYKNGTQNMVDHFRVADLYLEVFDGQPFVYNSMLDSYNEESQVVLMLKQLKSVYDNV